jgi:RNase P subunit RPR2
LAFQPAIDWDRCYDFKRIFSPKNLAKMMRFFAQTTATFCKNLITTLVNEKNAIFRQKSHKIVITTSTPCVMVHFTIVLLTA